MNNPFIAAKLIKKYETLPSILKAMGSSIDSFKEQAVSRQWTTVSLSGKLDDYEVNVSFHIKINKNKNIQVNSPRLIVTKLPLKEYQRAIIESNLQLLHERSGQ